ncbi:hypothetical protein FQN53_008506 [Emmonsiellopsis sp. PD_33]|nr:hypothetical protein FQN53_008506 [Emmonsiellopsis sp. PD_33]
MASFSAMSALSFLTLFALLLSSATAQTFTACNPTERDDCPNNPALGTNYTLEFNTDRLNDKIWNITNGNIDYLDDRGLFTIAERLQSPTVQSHFYIFFGRLEVEMKPSPGQGVVSSIVLQSEDLDEVDWEWVGNDMTHVQTNYFGKGNRTMGDRGGMHEMDAPMEKYHNYTLDWTAERLIWLIDGKELRTLTYDEALGGKNYPQTPMTVRLGIWPGGDPDKNEKGTVEWAGGEIDYHGVPYTMGVKRISVEDYSSGKEYIWSDRSGSWQSIKAVSGNSTIADEVHKPPRKSIAQKWRELPQTTKIAIIASAGGVVAIALVILAFCCIKQRRAGRKEHNIEESRFTTEQNDMITMQSQWKSQRYQHLR